MTTGHSGLKLAAQRNGLAHREHRARRHATKPIERLNGEIKRRTDVIGIFPDDKSIVRLIGALLLEQNDEWAVQRADQSGPAGNV